MSKRTMLFLVLTVLLRPAQDATADKQKNRDKATVIKNVTVISPERSAPLAHAVVVVFDGTIAEVGTDVVPPEHAKVIDGHGGFLIPGLIDSHVHVGNMGPLEDDAIEKHPELLEAYRAQLPRSYLEFGFTTLVDLDLREKRRSGLTPRRPIRTCAAADAGCASSEAT